MTSLGQTRVCSEDNYRLVILLAIEGGVSIATDGAPKHISHLCL